MSETKTPWTEGPWSVSHPGNGVRVEYEGEYRNDGWVIAELLGPDAEANARLIASSPALYEALEKALRQMRIWVSINGDMVGALQEVIDEGDAALALARGETK